MRLLSRHTYKNKALPLNFVENTAGYFEFNIAASITLPKGCVRLTVLKAVLLATTTSARRYHCYE